MKFLYSILLIAFSFSSWANVGDAIFLNACKGNPDKYFDKPLNLFNRIVEVPNIITKEEKTEFSRDFHTKAVSKIELPNNKIIYAEITNFRYLKIYDENNKVLKKRKVTGASSLYEYKFKNKVVAWGVGWHNECKEYYDYTDFTVLRTFAPYYIHGGIEIDDVILRPNISKNINLLKTIEHPIFTSSVDFISESKPYNCYYCGFELVEINNETGISIIFPEEIKDYNIDLSRNDDLVPSMFYISQDNKINLLKSFLDKNHKSIISSLIDEYYHSSSMFVDPKIFENLKYESVFSYNDKFINYYNENCDFNKLRTVKSVAEVCFPRHSMYLNLEP